MKLIHKLFGMGGGNPYHNMDGKFTTGGGQQDASEVHNPFSGPQVRRRRSTVGTFNPFRVQRRSLSRGFGGTSMSRAFAHSQKHTSLFDRFHTSD